MATESGVEIKYNGDTIATLSNSGTITALTAGKYCENNVVIEYTKPSGGGDEADLYAGYDEPTQAQDGDLWLDTNLTTIVPGDGAYAMSNTVAATVSQTSMKATGIALWMPAGTFRFKCTAARTSTSGTFTVQLYKNGTAINGATMTWSSRQGTLSADVSCAYNDKIEVYARSGSTSNYTIVGPLVACVDWDE